MEDALLRDDAADQEGDQHDDRYRTPAHLFHVVDGGGQAEAARIDQDMAGGGQHRAEHVDQADESAAHPDHAAADPFQHAGNGHGLAVGRRRGLHAAHFVDETRIVSRQARNLRLHPALAQAAAQALDQPGPKRVEPRDLGDVDEDVRPAAAELFGIGDDRLEHGGMTGDPLPRCGKRKPVAPCNPLQCRVAVHAAISGAAALRVARRVRRHAAPRLVEPVMYQSLWIRTSRRAAQNHQTLK